MGGIQTLYNPGSVSTVTSAPSVGGGAPSELAEFYRELVRRRSLASPSGGGAARGGSAAAAPPPPMAITGLHGRQSLQDRLDEVQDSAYRSRLRQIDLNPPKKIVGLGPQSTPGYIEDSTALPLSMRPARADIAYGPGDEVKARTRLADEGVFTTKLEGDRLRVAQGNNAFYGR